MVCHHDSEDVDELEQSLIQFSKFDMGLSKYVYLTRKRVFNEFQKIGMHLNR